VGAQEQRDGEEQYEVPADIRDASFPFALRGYSSEAVDAYVARVNAELEVRSSPRAAVRDALDRVGEQVGGILQRAREAAAEVTAAAQREAAEITARARNEATALVSQARAQADRERMQAQEALAQARAAAEAIVGQANAEAAETRRRTEHELAALHEEAKARLAGLRADTAAVWSERVRLLDSTRETAARLEALVTKAGMEFSPNENEPTQEQPAVVAVEPGGDVAAKRRSRAARRSQD
jgi:DivIVA domain-containing protein